MKKSLLVLASLIAAGAAHAQANDTLKKLKDSGVATMGVRESSGALSFTLGDGKYVGFHVEVCQRVLADIEKQIGRKLEVKYQPVTSQNRCSAAIHRHAATASLTSMLWARATRRFGCSTVNRPSAARCAHVRSCSAPCSATAR